MRPDYLPIFVETGKHPTDSVSVDITRFPIASQTGPTQSIKGDGAVKDVESVFPEHLPRFGIKARNPFLLSDVHSNAPDDINPIVSERLASKRPHKNRPFPKVSFHPPATSLKLTQFSEDEPVLILGPRQLAQSEAKCAR